MVNNAEVQQEFNFFSEIWKLFKTLLPVSDKDDEEYWERAVHGIAELMKKYPGELYKDISLAILNELERRCRNCEDRNTGCGKVY